MRAYLTEANRDLLLQIEVVLELLGAASVQAELTHYLGEVAHLCAALRQQAMRNLKDLEYGVDETIDDILAATQSLTGLFELVNTRLASPIVRARKADRLGLLVLRWLHDSTPKTAVLPCGMADGSFAIYPTPQVPPIYLTPVTRQVTLLYLPLLFHEFGHLLYACHRQEMDDLVKEFQRIVTAALAPTSIRDQRGASRSAVFRRRAVTAWLAWVQEFFCDATGFTIGGPSFITAFSHYFRTRSRDHYLVSRDEQLQRRHPVTWLRAKLLVDRARRHGMTLLADQVEVSWAETAQAMGIMEDYGGTWQESFLSPLQQCVDDMITVAEPYRHVPTDVELPAGVERLNIVQLCNEAWRQFGEKPEMFRAWERQAIEKFLLCN